MLDIPRNIDTTLGYTAGPIDTVDHVAGSIRKPMDDLTFALSRVGVDVVSLTDKQLDLIRQHSADYGGVSIIDVILLLGHGHESST